MTSVGATVELEFAYGPARGPSTEDCHVIGYRYPVGASTLVGDAWVLQIKDRKMVPLIGGLLNLNAVWRAPSGALFVTEVEGKVHYNAETDPARAAWRSFEFPFLIAGIFGLREDCVFVWGVRDAQPAVARWDGKAWALMPPPQGFPLAMDGTAADALVLVGHDGLVTRWDGQRWTRVEVPTTTRISSVSVAGSQIWVGTALGEVLCGGVSNLELKAQTDGCLTEIRFWQGHLYAASSLRGLLQLDGVEFRQVDEVSGARSLDGTESMLISAPHAVVMTEDGVHYEGFDLSGFIHALEPIPFTRGSF